MTRQEIYEASKKYTLFTWAPQGGYDPIVVDKVDGVHFWDMDGTRYTDLSSQLVCVNTGFNQKEIMDAVAEQLYKFPYVAPRHTYEARAELGKVIIEEIAPKNMAKVLFGLGGAEPTSSPSAWPRSTPAATRFLPSTSPTTAPPPVPAP